MEIGSRRLNNKKIIAMIQARVDSTRLNNKIFLQVSGKPMLQYVIEAVEKSSLIDEVIVVTSIEKSNLTILELCARLGIRVYVGSEADVLDRYYQAARLFKPDYVVRVTGDCPLFDGELLDQAILQMELDSDYLGMMTETFADGLDLEIVSFDALKSAWSKANLKSEREHVTQYILHHPELFKLQDFVSPIGYFGNNRWTLDEAEDFILIKTILEHFINCNIDNYGYKDILEFIKQNPDITKINAMYSRNEGLAKSLKSDVIVNGGIE